MRTLLLILLVHISAVNIVFAQNINEVDSLEILLQDVIVTANRSTVKVNADKLIYDISADGEAKSQSLIELIRKVPLLTVDGDESIKLNGLSDFKVYVDGKENKMMTSHVSEAFRSMPASSIKKIEVIVNPGAKYDAEGVGGIINLITAGRSAMDGFLASAGGGWAMNGESGNISATFKTGKLVASFMYGLSHSSPRADISKNTINHTNSVGLVSDYYESLIKRNTISHYASLNASYDFDKRNLLTLNGDFEYYNGRIVTHEDASISALQGSSFGYSRYTPDKNIIKGLGVGIDYQHILNHNGGTFTISYRITDVPSKENTSTEFYDIWGMADDISGFQNIVSIKGLENTGQIDYTKTFDSTLTFSTGVKYIGRRNHTRNSQLGIEQQTQVYENEFKQHNDIYAMYGEYRFNKSHWSAIGGLRYEYSCQSISMSAGKNLKDNYVTHLNDWVPSLLVAYGISDTRNLKLAYNIRIQRPNIWMLNPYVDDTDPSHLKYGNPDLKSTRNHQVELSFGSFGQKFGINTSLGFQYCGNGIEAYSFIDNESVVNDTYGNIVKRQSIYMNLYMNWNLGQKTVLNMNASGNYTEMKSGELNQSQSGFSGNVTMTLMQRLPYKINVMASGGLNSRTLFLQGYCSGTQLYRLSFNRSFLKNDCLTISIFASNIFNSYLKIDRYVHTQNFNSATQTWRGNFRDFGINVNFRFGRLRESVKRSNRTIINDDLNNDGNPKNK